MKRAARYFALVMIALVVVASVASSAMAQQQSVPSTWIDIGETSTAFGSLVADGRRAASTEEFWLGYTFALRDGVHIGCDDWNGRQISFGSKDMRFHIQRDGDESDVTLCEENFGLFLRFEGDDSNVAEARMMTVRHAASRLDEPVVWAGEVPGDSIAFLRGAVLGDGAGAATISASTGKTRERLLAAVAVQQGEAADEVVREALNVSQPAGLRESAVFWVAQFGGDDGLQRLIGLARNDADKEVRQQSIFWLAQVAGERATEHLADIAEDDPDTEVRQAAVFALSQTEDDAAIDALVNIVRTHDNREVVQSALFWLGQSGDPRAVELIEELLFGRGR